MTTPADTIREMLAAGVYDQDGISLEGHKAAVAALTELEQQLAAHKPWLEDELDECDRRATAAEAERDRLQAEWQREAERDAIVFARYREALEQIVNAALREKNAPYVAALARAALATPDTPPDK